MNSHLADVLGASAGEGNGKQITVYIVRHGATKMNNQTDMSEDRIRGWRDVPLVEEGREDARKAALKLKGKDIGAIVASDLCRASETAEIIGKIIGIKPEMSEKLRPWNLGKMTGQSTKEALPELAGYVRNKPDEAVPEGESFNKFKARAFQGFAEAVAKHPGKTVLLVTHHRDERLIESWDEAGQPEDHSIDLDVFLQKGDPPGGVRTLRTTEEALKGKGMAYSDDDPAAVNRDARQTMGKMAIDRDNGKLSHKAVQYGLAKGSDKCANCKAYQGKNDCTKVVAPIYPAGWCLVGHSKEDGHAFDPKGEAIEAGGEEPADGKGLSIVETLGGPRADMTDVMAHGRAIAGAKALHAVGHINEKQRDRHIKKSQKAIGGGRKPFGAFAPT